VFTVSIGPPLKTLDIYDVLTNLVPGAVFLLSLIGLFVPPNEISSITSGGAVAAFLVISYVLGHAVQWLGSEMEGTPLLFRDTMMRIRGEELEDGDLRTDIALSDVEERFWKICAREFDLSEDFSNYGKLLQLITSRLETTGAGRASRFQSIYSFHRSMWAACTAILAITIISIPVVLALRDRFPILGYGIVSVSATIGLFVFQDRKQKFDKTFISYLIVDFYTTHVDPPADDAEQRTDR
jgi:hypothetical protein